MAVMGMYIPTTAKLNLFNQKYELDHSPIEEAASVRPAALTAEAIYAIC